MIKTNSNAEYHSGEGVSKSDLDLIHKCPAIYKYNKSNPEEPSAALIFGSMFHKLVLEPEDFGEEYAVAPAVDRRTKEGKQVWTDFLEANKGKALIAKEDFDTATAMCEAVRSNNRAAWLLDHCKSREQSLYWRDKRTGTLCKARPDAYGKNYILDLKTTQSAAPDEFERSAYNCRYHVQAAWYSRAFKEQFGENELEDFVFIAVEKKAPYAVAIYVCDEIMLEVGGREADADLDAYCKCAAADKWYGYGGEEEQIMPLSIPYWAAKKLEV